MADARKEMIIGTREAAVLSCVNVIAAVTSQREELLAYWLDLYYQVRLAYEREIHPEQFTAAPAPVVPVMRPEDVYSAVRQIWGERIELGEESPSRCAAAPFYPKGHARQGGQERRRAAEGGGPYVSSAASAAGRVSSEARLFSSSAARLL